MTEQNNDPGRDDEVGAALRSLELGTTPDGFWSELSDGLLGDTITSEPSVGEQVLELPPVAQLRPRRWTSSRILMAAAALVVLGGIAIATQRGGSQEAVLDIAATTATTNPVPTAVIDAQPTTQAETEPVPGVIETALIDGSGLVFYGGSFEEVTLSAPARVVGGTSSVLLSWPIPSTDGAGCEGMGSVQGLIAVDGRGVSTVDRIGPSGGGFSVVRSATEKLAVVQRCEGSIDTAQVGTFEEGRGFSLDLFLQAPADAVTFANFEPVWSADGAELYMHTYHDGGELRVTPYDMAAGTPGVSEDVGGVLLAELATGVKVVASDQLLVGDVQVMDLAGIDPARLRAKRSPDGKRVAISSGDWLVVVDQDANFNRRVELDVGPFDWSPLGDLALLADDFEGLAIFPIANASPLPVRVDLGSDPIGWNALAFAEEGGVIAVSGFSEETRNNVTKIFDFSLPTRQFGDEPTPSVFGTTEQTLGDKPLTLRSMGALETGMTVAEAEVAVGGNLINMGGSECGYAVLDGDPNSPWLMVITYQDDGSVVDFADGTIERIELSLNQETLSGIRIGSTINEVLAAYGERIERTPHKYSYAEGGEYLTFVPADQADAEYRLVMETFDGQVTDIRSGRIPAVEFVEGCS